jgi:hypothetical protein
MPFLERVKTLLARNSASATNTGLQEHHGQVLSQPEAAVAAGQLAGLLTRITRLCVAGSAATAVYMEGSGFKHKQR